MKICAIYIKGYQQFQDTLLDFTHPETGEPLERVCLIGPNGTGKSTVLRELSNVSSWIGASNNWGKGPGIQGRACVKIKNANGTFLVHIRKDGGVHSAFEVDVPVLQLPLVFDALEKRVTAREPLSLPNGRTIAPLSEQETLASFPAGNSKERLLIHVLADSSASYSDFDNTSNLHSLSEARKVNPNDGSPVIIGPDTQRAFRLWLTYLEEKRRDDQMQFFKNEENKSLTLDQAIEAFDRGNPSILDVLAEHWNKILIPAGLEFDPKQARVPVHVENVFEWYPRLKSNGEATIRYKQLSTGMLNYIFRLGHLIVALHATKPRPVTLLVDEPENSLFPDFLFQTMQAYEDILKGRESQSFFATHNPIVAAQFEPFERVVLDWDEAGSVKAHRGVSPVGDDPNDVLHQDFGLIEVMGPKGREMWQKYQALRLALGEETNDTEKRRLIHEISQIGNQYNF